MIRNLLISLFLSLLVIAASTQRYRSCDDIKQENIKKVLLVTAHPDDIETLAGGTVAFLSLECQLDVAYLITTNGDKGWSKNYDMSSKELAQIRKKETRDAADVLGVKSLFMLNQEDGRLEGVDYISLKRNITKVVRTFTPDLLITFSPNIDLNAMQFGLIHQDHTTTGQSALNVVWPAGRDYLSFIELYEQGYTPHIIPTVWLFTISTNDNSNSMYIDITDNKRFDRKVDALLQHKSQYNTPQEVVDSLAQLGSYISKDPNKKYEAFTVVDIPH